MKTERLVLLGYFCLSQMAQKVHSVRKYEISEKSSLNKWSGDSNTLQESDTGPGRIFPWGKRTINKIGKVTGLGRQDSWLLALPISGLLSLCASDASFCEGVRQVHV